MKILNISKIRYINSNTCIRKKFLVEIRIFVQKLPNYKISELFYDLQLFLRLCLNWNSCWHHLKIFDLSEDSTNDSDDLMSKLYLKLIVHTAYPKRIYLIFRFRIMLADVYLISWTKITFFINLAKINKTNNIFLCGKLNIFLIASLLYKSIELYI